MDIEGGDTLKYVSINRLSDFEFHDAEFIFDSFVNNNLSVKVSYLNIHKDTEQTRLIPIWKLRVHALLLKDLTSFHTNRAERGKRMKTDSFIPMSRRLFFPVMMLSAAFLNN